MYFPICLIMSLTCLQISESNSKAVDLSNLSSIKTQSATEQISTIDHQCHYPFNPSSIITILIFKKKGIDFITKGEKRCTWHFSKKIENIIRDSIILPKFYKKKLLKDIEEAKNKGKSI